MKILICDYRDTLASRDVAYEMHLLRGLLPGAEVTTADYTGQEQLIADLQGAQGLITAFVPVGEEIFVRCTELRCVSVNATGYNAIDMAAATNHHVAVCAIGEYCTQEVADHTMAMVLALARRLKAHQRQIDREHRWQYRLVGPVPRLQGKTFAIFGLGRIGQAVARRAKGFGFQVVAVDPYLPEAVARQLDLSLVDRDFVCRNAHFIVNHMAATRENAALFDAEFFSALQQSPVFVNAARADAVDEEALTAALDRGLICAAGLDVLRLAGQDLDRNPLVGRDNVILTPHAAFYSVESLRALQDISCGNMAAFFHDKTEEINIWVNEKELQGEPPQAAPR